MSSKAINDSRPLSSMQAGMLYHHLSAGQSGVDVEQIFCTTSETLEAAAFERAWQHVVNRHEILRTSFHWDGTAGPRQVVHPSAAMEFVFADWSHKPPAEQQNLFESALQANRQRGFQLTESPLMRVSLFRTRNQASRFIWTFHHMLLDGRSVVMVLNEVFASYENFRQGAEPELPTPRPFREYVDWLQQQDWSAAETFWRQILKGFVAPAPLRLAPSPESAGELSLGEQEATLSEPITTALKSLARQHGLTANTMLQGAWALLLSRYRREDDVIFGVIRAGRRANVPNAGGIVGMLINTVPLRVRVAPEKPLMEWLQGVRETWNALRDFEHTPLVNVQAWSGVPHGQLMFESIFNYQDPSWDAALKSQGGNWTKRDFGIRSQSNYPLVVDAYGGAAVKIKILYHRNRFGDASIAQMLGHFKTLLESMAANSKKSVGQLAMITETERWQLLVEWNDTAADFPRDKCVHELIEEQACRTPGALAVTDGTKQLSYAELDALANSLAEKLRLMGVKSDVCVGVCMERCADMVAAKIAVWKAGGAYVPLDPSYPANRLKFMLEDARMPVLITHSSLRNGLSFGIPNLRFLCVDEAVDLNDETKTKDSPRPANARPQPASLAYVIYTSGSTGQPKGVEIEHRSLVNLITWHQQTYQLTSLDRATQVATPAFDASVWELWPYLTCGASIHIPDEETRLSPKKLLRWLDAERITLSFIPTPIAEAMLDESWPETGTLRAILTGGDKLRGAPKKELPCDLVNHYGPTENTVVTTWTPVPPSEKAAIQPPIGRPIANVQVFILDPQLQLVPVGVAGELHIAGAGLARGYHNRPDLTAGKFIANPFSKSPNARLYKTGDLARWLPGGQIEFLGRLDEQVKIRGQRIELGEIETVLGQHPDVREAVVVLREDAGGKHRLAAYVVPCTGAKPQSELLRKFLQTHLTEAMVPSAFVILPDFPLTSNGKVDRKSLPAPVFESEKEFIVPRTEMEKKIARIWREVLGPVRVGTHDNFFEMGGHSLTATQVVSRLNETFQAELLLPDLFAGPTVAELSRFIETRMRGSKRVANVKRRAPASSREAGNDASGPHDNLPLSFAQERVWFMELLEPGKPFNNIPIAWRIEGPLNIHALERSISEIVRRHQPLRTIFRNQDGRPTAIVSPPLDIKISVVDLSHLPSGGREQEANNLISGQASRPFDLGQAPLLRAQLLRLEDGVHWLLLTTHHIVCDGWSMGVFYRELTSLYEAFPQNRPSPLPKLRSNYTDFVRSQHQLRTKTLEDNLDFWKNQLSDAQTTLELPTDRPRPAVQTYHGAMKTFTWPAPFVSALKELARKEDVTLFMLLLAAFQTLLHRHTGQEDFLIGSPIAGRTTVENEPMIGLFLNTLVLRGDLSGSPTFRELLRRVRKTTLAAYTHQNVPFEKLVETLQPGRDLSRSPLFQVMFILQNEPIHPPELAGLKLTSLPVHSGTAKFDLTLSLEEGPAGIDGFIEYNTDLFADETMTRLLGHYQTLLEAISLDVEQQISTLPLLGNGEREQIFSDWNNTDTEFQKDVCIHELFSEQVSRTPDKVALVFDSDEMTYRELDRRANQLADCLQKLGVGPEVRVGICVRRSLDMVVALMGILKSGGCYVPLDPTYPQERLGFMLKDSQATVLLTETSLHGYLSFEIPDLKLLCLDEPSALETPPPDHDNHVLANTHQIGKPASHNLAYVIYTSGSTGQPKGVMLTHRTVVNFFAGMDRVLGTNPGVWLAVTSISFDISVLELFWTLCRGFKVVIQPAEDHDQKTLPTAKSAGRQSSLPEQILRHNVTHLQCTPSLAGTLLLSPESQTAVRSLNKLLLGGEALPASLATQFREVLSGELLNLYGPTETTVWSAVHRVDKAAKSIPIGRPLANTKIYILDKNLQLRPAGVPGEIFIGGEGVARGYLNRPELTAAKFVPDPFDPDPASRLYRTGDLGRWLPDGNLEFLGRMDHQVKIRGHRIEIGEIESTLARHPAVREAAVAAREVEPGDKRLAAYVVPAAGAEPTAGELRRFLQNKLPDVMVPSIFMFLEQMPLTPNGKLNRNALPAPEDSQPKLETAYVQPRGDSENTIAGIWRELLHVAKVGRHDNFFDLGGNSLLIVQLQARLRDAVKLNLPVVKLFQYPTVAAQADFLINQAEKPSVNIRERGRRKQAVLARRENFEETISA